MREAASYLVGEHSFKNFCKINKSKPNQNYRRKISQFDVNVISEKPENVFNQVCEFVISGTAFLWHQVRFMVGVLFLVGQGLEAPTIVRDLLDFEKYPNRPVFQMAPDFPLVLFDCVFDDLQFECPKEVQEKTTQLFMDQYQTVSIKAALTRLALQEIHSSATFQQPDAVGKEKDKKVYIPIANLAVVGDPFANNNNNVSEILGDNDDDDQYDD